MTLWLGCSLLVGSSPAQAKSKLPLQDVLVLLQVGYQEAQIIVQIEQAGMRGKYELTPLQVLQLRKAGASIQLIRIMGLKGLPAAPKTKPPVSIALLRKWLTQKKPTSWIEQQLKQRGIVAKEFDPFAILELNREGLPLSLLRLIVQLKQRKPPVQPNIPTTPTTPTTPPTVPTTPPVVPTTPTVPTTPQTPPARTEPAVPPPLDASDDTVRALREREARLLQRDGVAIKRPVHGIYQHAGRYYQLPIPKGWNVLEDIHPDAGQLQVYFTPETTKRLFNLQQGFAISIEYLPHNDRFLLTRSLTQMGKYLLGNLLVRERGLQTKQALKKTKFQNIIGVSASVEGKSKERSHPLRMKFLMIRRHRALMTITIFSPPATFAALETKVQAILGGLQLLHPSQKQLSPRLPQEQTVQHIIQNNTRGVVSISLGIRKDGKLIYKAAGTGFVVTSDGYVLTNHHVAIDRNTGKPYESYTLNWDQTTGQASVRAICVGYHYQYPSRERVRLEDANTGRISVRFQRQHVDIALLKIVTPGVYPTVKLVSARQALLGDNVVAMGFPLEGSGIQHMGNESITATSGRISRFVRLGDQAVNEIQHTAKVAGGNSGGPLLDTSTGGVIGINTWVGIFDKRLGRPGMGLGYYYAIPIDLGWKYFPDFLNYTGRKMRAQQWFDLGLKWFADGQLEPAKRAFLRVVRQKPDFLPAYMALSQLFVERANHFNDDSHSQWMELARKWADRGLKRDTYHLGLMRLLAKISMLQGQFQTASVLLQQAIGARPHDWSLFVMRSLLRNAQKQYKAALKDASRVSRLAGKWIPTGQIIKGMILYSAKRYFEGQRAFREALKLDPNNLQAQLGEALGYAHLKQFDDALQHYEQIAKKHPYEPQVYQRMMMMLTAAPLENAKLKAWNAFQMLMQSSSLRGVTLDASALFVGGVLAKQVLNAKVRDRVMWGIWGGLLDGHTKNPITGQAGLILALQAFQKGQRGLAYGIAQMLHPSLFKTEKHRKSFAQLKQHATETGLSSNELMFLALETVPRWSPSLIFRIFRATPSVLEVQALRTMYKRGVSPQLLWMMFQLSKQRSKAGVRPAPTPTAPAQGQKQNSQNTLYARQRAIIHRVAQLAFQSLRNGDIDTWMGIHDPQGDTDKYDRLFWVFRKSLSSRQFVIFPVRKINVQFVRHPTVGITARYFFPMRVGNQPTKLYYWHFRIRGNRWVMF